MSHADPFAGFFFYQAINWFKKVQTNRVSQFKSRQKIEKKQNWICSTDPFLAPVFAQFDSLAESSSKTMALVLMVTNLFFFKVDF